MCGRDRELSSHTSGALYGTLGFIQSYPEGKGEKIRNRSNSSEDLTGSGSPWARNFKKLTPFNRMLASFTGGRGRHQEGDLRATSPGRCPDLWLASAPHLCRRNLMAKGSAADPDQRWNPAERTPHLKLVARLASLTSRRQIISSANGI